MRKFKNMLACADPNVESQVARTTTADPKAKAKHDRLKAELISSESDDDDHAVSVQEVIRERQMSQIHPNGFNDDIEDSEEEEDEEVGEKLPEFGVSLN